MEDIVGIKFCDKKYGQGAVITWGRVFDIIDDEELLKVVSLHLRKYGTENIESIELCYSLMEIADQPYFYETLIHFIQEPIPFGCRYQKWLKKKRRALNAGEEIGFVGFKQQYFDYLERMKHGILL